MTIDTVLRPSAPCVDYRETLKLSTVGDATGALRVMAVTELLDALGYRALSREVKASTSLADLRRYATVVVNASTTDEFRERAEELFRKLGLR